MSAQTYKDPFDLGFDADDEFDSAGPKTGWERDAAPAVAEAHAEAEMADPFADLPPARAVTEDPFVEDTPSEAASVSPTHPVHEMLAMAATAFGDAPVPRIVIHAFVSQTASAETLERAASDRRMERATVKIEMGGVPTALALYQTAPTPSLVLIESLEPAGVLLQQLDRLAELCDPSTKVVVIGAANDIALYRELMRRGVSEYLTPPLSPIQVIQTISALYADPATPFIGRQIAFCGAKGGVGASTLAHNFAYSLTERLHTNAVLVDLDLPFGTAGLDFNQEPPQGVVDALTHPDRLDPVLMERMMARCSERLSLFAAPATLDQDYEIGAEAYEEVTQKIRGAAPFIVLDLPHIWNAWSRKVLISSDDVVIIATPDLASLRNAKNIIDLVRRARPNDAPPRLVLNQVGVPGRPEIPTKDFAEALGLTPDLSVPFEPRLFGVAANNGQMLAEVAPKARTVEAIDLLAQQISRREPVAQVKTSLLARLFRRG